MKEDCRDYYHLSPEPLCVEFDNYIGNEVEFGDKDAVRSLQEEYKNTFGDRPALKKHIGYFMANAVQEPGGEPCSIVLCLDGYVRAVTTRNFIIHSG